MGTVRTCGSRCHSAKSERCVCWCGGLFHGAAGDAARQAFRDRFQETPATEADFDRALSQGDLFAGHSAADTWRAAISRAREARAGA